MTKGRQLLAVTGLTCTGKSALALALAGELGGPDKVEIVVCDAVKVYRGADVGSGKLIGAGRRGYAFHMIDVVPPGELYSAGRYMTYGRAVLSDIWDRGKLPIVVGGTGLYYRALRWGICAAPAADAAVRTGLRERRAAGEDLLETLRRVDAASAEKTGRDDEKRIIRALEVYILTGRPLSEIRADGSPALAVDKSHAVWLDAPRDWLLPHVAARTRRMVASGLLAETEKLWAALGERATPPLGAIGYREALECLRGELAEDGLEGAVTAATLRLAKRQRTWFKKEQETARLEAPAGTAALAAAILASWNR